MQNLVATSGFCLPQAWCPKVHILPSARCTCPSSEVPAGSRPPGAPAQSPRPCLNPRALASHPRITHLVQPTGGCPWPLVSRVRQRLPGTVRPARQQGTGRCAGLPGEMGRGRSHRPSAALEPAGDARSGFLIGFRAQGEPAFLRLALWALVSTLSQPFSGRGPHVCIGAASSAGRCWKNPGVQQPLFPACFSSPGVGAGS